MPMIRKEHLKFLHHQVSSSGTPGAANLTACSAVIANLNGGRTPPNIPDADRRGVHSHVAAHLRDAGKEVPPLKTQAEVEGGQGTQEQTQPQAQSPAQTVTVSQDRQEEVFASVSSVLPSTLNSIDRSIDVCWYGGATVPRYDRNTGKQYLLRLDPNGCRMERLNAGGPVFDSHMTGMDFPSMLSNKMGMKAQCGVVLKSWVESGKCYATVKFAADEESDAVYQKVAGGIAKNLSFGCWIYAKEDANPRKASNGEDSGEFVATDWEVFEISVVSVPADYTTEFMSAAGATSGYVTETEIVNVPVEVTFHYPGDAQSQEALSTKDRLRALLHSLETTQKEFADKVGALGAAVSAPSSSAVPVSLSSGSPATDVVEVRATALEEETTMAQENPATTGAEARASVTPVPVVDEEKIKNEAMLAERTRQSEIRALAAKFPTIEQSFVDGLINSGVAVLDAGQKMLKYLADQSDRDPISTVTITRDQTDTRRAGMEAALMNRINPQKYPFKDGLGADYRGMTLVDMGRECLSVCGIKTRGMDRGEVARVALQGRYFGAEEYFVGAQGTSDFPNILANVATKMVRIAYELAPRTFMPFTRRMSAPDFKQIYAVQLSDIPVMAAVNENGEFQQANLSDSKETLQVLTYGQIVNITRQAVVNDNLQILDTVPSRIGRGAATLENSVVWAIITGNAAMSDTVAIFHATHANLNTGAGSALGLTGLSNARLALRKQTGPKANILNLLPASVAVPAALETTLLQLLFPQQYSPTTAATVIPTELVRNLTPIVEPVLDANSTAYWYMFADPSVVDIIAYAYLEGQEGVYTETKQGFEVDGVQIKGRLDFGAAMLDHRGAVRSNGA